MKVGVIEAPINLSGVYFGHEGESLSARLAGVRAGGMIPGDAWYCVEGWVTQLEDGAVFQCPKWPPGKLITPREAFRCPFVVMTPHVGIEWPLRSFPVGVTSSRNVSHLVCIDAIKRG